MKRVLIGIVRRCRVVLFIFCCCLAGSVAAGAESNRGYTATRYPLVLVPGAFGFGAVAGVLDYWFNMTHPLADSGAEVYLAQISPLNSTELRGEQLVSQLEDIVAISGAPKVNLIGHSHGGLTARYAAAVVPHLVASVTTIASPHRGSAVADWLADDDAPGRKPLRWVLAWFANHLARTIGWLSRGQHPNDALVAMRSLTTYGAHVFNSKFPHGVPVHGCGNGAPGVQDQRFYSWTGVGERTNRRDIADPILALTGEAFAGAANDGLVGQCSAHFGHVIRDDYVQNHFDNVNHTLGLVGIDRASPVELLRVHANRLKVAGL